MQTLDCEQLSIDNNWSLTRKNSCHISNMNSEIGELTKQMEDIVFQIKNIAFKQDVIFGIFGAIGLCLIGIMLKNYFFLKKNHD